MGEGVEVITETDSMVLWVDHAQDTTFHLDFGNITVHFFEEEWKEFIQLVDQYKAMEAARDALKG